MKSIALAALTLMFFGCKDKSRIVREDRVLQAEFASPIQDIGRQNIRENKSSSEHIIRILTTEKPHYHEDHDVLAFVMEGCGKMHFRGQEQFVRAGDVITIGRGQAHWLENQCDFVQVYAIFTPPYDGKDSHLIKD